MARGFNNETKDLPKAKINRDSIKTGLRILSFMGPHKWKFILGLVFLALTSATALAFPMLMGKLVDTGKQFDLKTANLLGLVLLVILLAQSFFSFFRMHFKWEMNEQLYQELLIKKNREESNIP